MNNFTPCSALLGGILIGLSVVLYFYTTGRLAGVSGIVENAITKKANRLSNILFLLGLVLGPLLYSITKEPLAIAFTLPDHSFTITDSYPLIIIGGLLVGLGTRLSGGCTSGHGICGIGRLSISSLIATVVFVGVAMLTVTILQQYGIYL
jgi:hypothetical protein